MSSFEVDICDRSKSRYGIVQSRYAWGFKVDLRESQCLGGRGRIYAAASPVALAMDVVTIMEGKNRFQLRYVVDKVRYAKGGEQLGEVQDSWIGQLP